MGAFPDLAFAHLVRHNIIFTLYIELLLLLGFWKPGLKTSDSLVLKEMKIVFV